MNHRLDMIYNTKACDHSLCMHNVNKSLHIGHFALMRSFVTCLTLACSSSWTWGPYKSASICNARTISVQHKSWTLSWNRSCSCHYNTSITCSLLYVKIYDVLVHYMSGSDSGAWQCGYMNSDSDVRFRISEGWRAGIGWSFFCWSENYTSHLGFDDEMSVGKTNPRIRWPQAR
jgi:hypothetical protein